MANPVFLLTHKMFLWTVEANIFSFIWRYSVSVGTVWILLLSPANVCSRPKIRDKIRCHNYVLGRIQVLKNSYQELARKPKHFFHKDIKLVILSSVAFQQEHVTSSENAFRDSRVSVWFSSSEANLAWTS